MIVLVIILVWNVRGLNLSVCLYSIEDFVGCSTSSSSVDKVNSHIQKLGKGTCLYYFDAVTSYSFLHGLSVFINTF